MSQYYDVENRLGGAQKTGTKKTAITDAASAYFLLKSVKCEGKKDKVWMTFYEGLH
jgi:hypothetical protein